YRVQEAALASGFHAVLGVPMLREGRAIGSIALGRSTPGPYGDGQIALLQTFAAQAVIAIENVRLFKELEARNQDLPDSLTQQTATAEILRVISSSPTDIQPVFDAIVTSVKPLLDAFSATVLLLVGDEIHLMAFTATSESGDEFLKAQFPMPL